MITPSTTINDAFTLFLCEPGRKASTKAKFRTKFKGFLAAHGSLTVGGVSGDLLENWFLTLEEREGYSPGHLAFHRNCHATFWRWCSQFTGTNPALHLPRFPQSPTRIITADIEDIRLALDTCELLAQQSLPEQRDAAIMALSSCGLRRSNLRAMAYSETRHALAHPLPADDRLIYLLTTGGKARMEIVLDGRRAAIIQQYINNRPPTPHDRLFINLNHDHPHYLKPLSNEGLARARRRVCEVAGIPPLTFQQIRRTIGTTVARRHGVALAAQVLGHRSGVQVILNHYYDPDKEAARLAALTALE